MSNRFLVFEVNPDHRVDGTETQDTLPCGCHAEFELLHISFINKEAISVQFEETFHGNLASGI